MILHIAPVDRDPKRALFLAIRFSLSFQVRDGIHVTWTFLNELQNAPVWKPVLWRRPEGAKREIREAAKLGYYRSFTVLHCCLSNQSSK